MTDLPRPPWPTMYLRNRKGARLCCVEVRCPTDLHGDGVPIIVDRAGPLEKGVGVRHLVCVPEGIGMVRNMFMPTGYCRLWYADGSHVFVPPREGRVWVGKGFKRRKIQSSDVPTDVPVLDGMQDEYVGKRVVS